LKPQRLHRQLAPALHLTGVRPIGWTLRLTRDEAQAVIRMGPAARHLRPDMPRRLALLPEPVLVTAALELRVFHRPPPVPCAVSSRGYVVPRRASVGGRRAARTAG
jgi:hypothetical protein